MKKTYNYIAEANAGKAEKQRLELQHKIFGSGTERFLLSLLKLGMTVLVVGCGTGEETCFIANAIAPSGKVVAIDLNEKQLEEISEQVSQPIMNTAEEKMIVPLSAAACSKGYLSRGLITEEGIKKAL